MKHMRLKDETRSVRRSGFTLIELLVVMGIVILMVTLALVSVASMLRSSRGVSCSPFSR